MRWRLRQPGALLLSLALCAPFVRAQAPAPPQPQAQDQTPPIYPAETQTPLDASHDPVVSPDVPDNAPARPGAAHAATPPTGSVPVPKSGAGVYTLRRDVQEVQLNVTVLNDHGEPVNDLAQGDFRVFENGVEQTLSSFLHGDVPVSMGLLVDNSGSMRPKRMAVNAAALDMVRASNPQDEAFVVNFSDEAFIDQDFTSDLNKLRDGLAHYDARGGTAIYDATVASADELAKHAKQGKQVLLIITDGEDNASGLTLDQAIRRVQDLHGPIVYCIGLLFGDSGGESREARHALEALAEETGGIAYFPKSLDDVDGIAGEVARDIRSQYMLGYHPSKPESAGGYRQIKVTAHAANSHKNLTVRTRSGYYATIGNTSPSNDPQITHPEQ